MKINIQKYQFSTFYFNSTSVFWLALCTPQFSFPFSFVWNTSVSGQPQPFIERQKRIVIKEDEFWNQILGKLTSLSFTFLTYKLVSWYCLSCSIILKTRRNDICKLLQFLLRFLLSLVICIWWKSLTSNFLLFHPFFFSFFLFRAAPVAYGGSQARGQIGVVAASLCHTHSNTGSEVHLWPTPQLTPMPDP